MNGPYRNRGLSLRQNRRHVKPRVKRAVGSQVTTGCFQQTLGSGRGLFLQLDKNGRDLDQAVIKIAGLAFFCAPQKLQNLMRFKEFSGVKEPDKFQVLRMDYFAQSARKFMRSFTPTPVAPLQQSKRGLSAHAVPAMSKCTHGVFAG